MKKCTLCGVEYSIDQFPKINRITGKRSSMHLECKRIYDREHYAKHKEKRVHIKRLNSKRCRVRNLQFSMDYLKNNPCIDCGEKDPIVLEYDHKGHKLKNVCNIIATGYSLDNLKKEIAKCEVVCANCHRRRTSKQFNYYKNIKL